jgi:hypothetical protein
MKVWVVIVPDNKLVGVFSTKLGATEAVKRFYPEWHDWGIEPREALVDETYGAVR